MNRHDLKLTVLVPVLAPILMLLPATLCCQDLDPTWTISQWEYHYDLQSGFFDDPDGDGVVNYVEFGYGLNPLAKDAIGDSAIDPRVTRTSEGAIKVRLWQPSFPNTDGLGDNAYGRHWFWIEVQASTDLENWTTIAEKPGMNGGFYGTVDGIEIIETKQDPTRVPVDIVDSRVIDGGSNYYRLRFTISS